MIAHVAEASEQSGRVVMWLNPKARCGPAVFEAPIRLAAAYGAEVETVAIALEEPKHTADIPIRRVSCLSTDRTSVVPLEDDRFALMTDRQRRAVESAAEARNVTVKHAWARGDAVDRIAEMCMTRGPWNIVALPDVPQFGGHTLISALLANVGGATGFLVCGQRPADENQRVVLLVEDGERFPAMLRAGERLAAGAGSIHIVIAAETAAEYDEVEAHVRLLTADHPAVIFVPSTPTLGVPGVVIERVTRLKPSFIIGRFGGSGLANGRELSRASAATRAPILLVR